MHSTSTALKEFIMTITESWEHKNIVLSTYLDLSKAFDSIGHSILIAKLPSYGITGKALKWINSYLISRQQKIKVNHKTSKLLYICTGVPQGLILSAVLFLLHINDIFLAIDSQCTWLILYEDDAACLISARSHELAYSVAKECLDKLHEWFQLNRLILNANKTKFSTLSEGPKGHSNIQKLQTSNLTTDRVSHFELLGVTVDEHPTWKTHITKISTNLSGAIAILTKLRPFVNQI